MLNTDIFNTLIGRTSQLGRWFLWGRRRLREEVVADLSTLSEAVGQAVRQLDAQGAQLVEWETRHALLSNHKDVLDAQLGIARIEVEETARTLGTVRDTLERVEGKYAALQERNELVVGLLSLTPPVNPGLARLRDLIEHDYMGFANEEQSLAEEAEALVLLQGVVEDLRMLSGFPGIYGKRRVAIAGGFSAGKSELVNSFIQDASVRLAVGIEPVTAIPTYVVSAPKAAIRAYGANGGSLELSSSMYKRISHDFVKSLGFDLKQLMPALSLGVPLDPELFSNLCIVDTPGYNPSAGDGYTEQDGATAREFVGSAAALLWVIGVDANGTVSASDLQFIRGLELGERPLYLVLNKVDLRSASEVEEVLAEVEDILAEENITVAGISAYSARRGKEYACRTMSLADFLRSQNRPAAAEERVLATVNMVFDMYGKALRDDLARCAHVADTFKSMQLDVLQYGNTVLYHKLEERFANMRDEFDRDQLNALMERAELLRGKLLQAVREALDGIAPRERLEDVPGPLSGLWASVRAAVKAADQAPGRDAGLGAEAVTNVCTATTPYTELF